MLHKKVKCDKCIFAKLDFNGNAILNKVGLIVG